MYQRLTTVPVELVLDVMEKAPEIQIEGESCKLTSVRLQTYKVHGLKCAWPGCSIFGEYFAVERDAKPSTSRYHLNLYGRNEAGEEIMMTSDHKIPKYQGGHKYSIKNRQPMCAPHNSAKGARLICT